MADTGLHPADYVVFALSLLVAMGVGLYHAFTGGRQRSTSEYLTGDRRLRVVPVGFSMFMSWYSAIYLLGVSAEVYLHGIQFWLSTFGLMMGLYLTAFIFVPLYHPLKLTSIFQHLDMRFRSRVLHKTVVVLEIITEIFNMGLTLFAPSTALEAVTNIPSWLSMLTCGVVVMIYTTVGGMKAVVWTDVFQGIIMLVGILTVLIVGCIKVGGLSEVWTVSRDHGRLDFFNFDPDPTARVTFWSLVLGLALKSMVDVGTQQTAVQRVCSLPTVKDAQRALFLVSGLIFILGSVVALTGLVIFTYYTKLGCDPLRAGKISGANQILPYFVKNVIGYPGIPGVVMATLFSGALSSLSSSMNSLSAITWSDLISPYYKDIPETRKVLITKILVMAYGACAIGLAFLVANLRGHVVEIGLSLIGGLNSPRNGIYLLGSFFHFTNWKGAIIGSVGSLGMASWMNVGSFLTSPHQSFLNTVVDNCTFSGNATALPIQEDRLGVFWLYRVSFLWVAHVATITCVALGLVFSLKMGKTEDRVTDDRLVSPLLSRACLCLPVRLRKYVWGYKSASNLNLQELQVTELQTVFLRREDTKESQQESNDQRDDEKGGVNTII